MKIELVSIFIVSLLILYLVTKIYNINNYRYGFLAIGGRRGNIGYE